MKKTKENKGITLIALIITIIVMLILVGVSVNVALNGGLFDTAKTASEKTNEAVQGEKDYIARMSLIAKSDKLVEEYPLNVEISEATFKLLDNNIMLLYKDILQEYGIELENLTLPQAIKTVNVFYEIYNNEIETHKEAVIRNDFWSEFIDPVTGKINTNNLTEEDNKILLALEFAYLLGADDTDALTSNINNVKYNILPNPIGLFGNMDEIFDTIYPGGHYPIDELTGTAESDFGIFESMDGLGKICIMTEEIANSNILFIDGNNNLLDAKEYIGNAICLISEEELGGDGSLNGGADYAGTPLKNVMLINTQTGDLIYIDDNGQPSKPLS